MIDRALLDIIRRIVQRETVFHRLYKAKVTDVQDPAGKGRIKAVVYDFVFPEEDGTTLKNEVAFWARSGDKFPSAPKVGSWVNLYFEAGDKNKPRFFGSANDAKDDQPDAYDGLPTTHVLFESPDGSQKITYNSLTGILEIGSGLEPMVLGATFMAYFNTHVHATAAAGPPSPPALPMTAAQLSVKVKGE